MAQPNVIPVRYPLYNQPPSYEECMGTQPPRYPGGLLHPPPPPPPQPPQTRAYVPSAASNEYDRAKREKKRRILTIGLVLTLCTIFMFIVLYIRLDLYHEAHKRHMENHFVIDNTEDSYWSSLPEKKNNLGYAHVESVRVSDLEMAELQRQLSKFWNTVTIVNFKNQGNPTESILETETKSYDQINNELPAIGVVNGTSD